MMHDISWYRIAKEIVLTFQQIADLHWQATDSPVPQSDPLLDAAFEFRNDDNSTNDQLARRELERFSSAYGAVPTIDTRQSDDLLELEMYVRLCQWLCSYFLGNPRFDAWDRVAFLANQLGAYPGGAFYDKLAGDVYRFERRQHAKRPEASRDRLLVMAYTPILLLPDEDDLTHIAQRAGEELPDEVVEFKTEVEKLACRYLRYQLWRYLRTAPVSGINYAISQWSVSESLCVLARQHVSSQVDWNDLTIHQRRDAVALELKLLKAKSDTRLAKFLDPSNAGHQKIAVFKDTAIRRRGLTSCVLGCEDGVTTNRPNRSVEPTAFCSWADGRVLRVERSKLIRLWREASPGESVIANVQSLGEFAEQWYDNTVESHVLEGGLNSRGFDLKGDGPEGSYDGRGHTWTDAEASQ